MKHLFVVLSGQFCAQSHLQLLLDCLLLLTARGHVINILPWSQRKLSLTFSLYFLLLGPCFCLFCPFSSGHFELNWQSEPRPFCFSDIDDSWLASGSVDGFINQSFARSHARCSIGINMRRDGDMVVVNVMCHEESSAREDSSIYTDPLKAPSSYAPALHLALGPKN